MKRRNDLKAPGDHPEEVCWIVGPRVSRLSTAVVGREEDAVVIGRVDARVR